MKTFGTVIAALSLLGWGIFRIVIHFLNPDMTETRLLINYWHLHLFWFLGMIFGLIILNVFKDHD